MERACFYEISRASRCLHQVVCSGSLPLEHARRDGVALGGLCTCKLAAQHLLLIIHMFRRALVLR